MSSIADARAHDRDHAPHPDPRRRNIRPAATLREQADYYLGLLLAQAERDSAIHPTVTHDETRVRDHLIAQANGGQPRDDGTEAAVFRVLLLNVMRRVAGDWGTPFDLVAARGRIRAGAITASGANPAVDQARYRAQAGNQ